MARKQVRKPHDIVQLKLRFPEALRRRLEREAKRHGTSLNSEIIRILEDAFLRTDRARIAAETIAQRIGEDIAGVIVATAKRILEQETSRSPESEPEETRWARLAQLGQLDPKGEDK
jgi:Arc-like DNA binding domain